MRCNTFHGIKVKNGMKTDDAIVCVTVISAEFVWKGVFTKEKDGLDVGRGLGCV